MKISFQKKAGIPSLDVTCFWKMTIETRQPAVITDHIIPELFFDFLYVKEGRINCVDPMRGRKFTLPQQSLKTVHTRPIRFIFSTPLVLYGARLPLRFAEVFWGAMQANTFSNQAWIQDDLDGLDSFKERIAMHLKNSRVKKTSHPMFSSDLNESAWLGNFSPRHKRRLYREIFGLSRRKLQNIGNVHTFLEQTCDFASENPRIIRHVNPDVFYDQPHLNRIFKKMTGFSPVEYFEANSILQDNLMSVSYNENPGQ